MNSKNLHSRPLVPVNPNDLDDLDVALSGKRSEGDNTDFSFENIQVADAERYLFLPAKSHGSYNYPNTLISLERSYNGKNWFDTHKLLAAEGSYMPTIRQFVDFIKLLKSGKALNGKGQPLSASVIAGTLDDIFKLGDYRGRWLDADFKIVNGILHINYNHSLNAKGEIIPSKSEPLLASTLMSDRKPGIDLEDWINRATAQGLPSSDVKQGDIWYWHPGSDNNSVARFEAGSDGAGLDCNWDPSYADSSIGVNAAKKV